MRLIILGTGSMAGEHARNFALDPEVEIVAAVEPTQQRLGQFAEAHGIPHRFAGLDEAIAWGDFDAAANVTPDAVHYPTTMQLIAAGKDVFCEKPLATEYSQAREMADAADSAGVINMVNLTYRAAPPVQRAREMVLAGEIGTIKHFEASYLQSWLVGRHWGDWQTEDRWLWRLSSAHGSKGVIGDIGIHIVDFATYAAGSDIASLSSRVRTFQKVAGDRIGDYTLDANDSVVMSVELANGALGSIQATRWATGTLNDLRLDLYGDRGALRLLAGGRQSSLLACIGADIDTQTWREVACPPVPTNYLRFATAVRSRVNGDPDFRRAAALQHVLDLSFAADGLGSLAIA
ncbi:MAG: Gfo/Idh/MocA family oxidoreductase [Bauldia sp.]|nr:Gfo/Idh/MocA family oxidoreductase [Bauldia sp.]